MLQFKPNIKDSSSRREAKAKQQNRRVAAHTKKYSHLLKKKAGISEIHFKYYLHPNTNNNLHLLLLRGLPIVYQLVSPHFSTVA